jgi:predicted DNA-binding helix-hairpin-helix protein
MEEGGVPSDHPPTGPVGVELLHSAQQRHSGGGQVTQLSRMHSALHRGRCVIRLILRGLTVTQSCIVLYCINNNNNNTFNLEAPFKTPKVTLQSI